MSIGSPSTWPPASATRAIAARMSSTATTIDGCAALPSAGKGYRPPPMAPKGASGAPAGRWPGSAVVTSR